MRWIVFDKDGLTAKCEVRSLQYSGEFMGACSITAKVVSPNPVDFEIGDYLLYRGERFEINYDPTVLKQASSGSYGEGFVYDNIVFNSLSDELTRCDFLDYVPNDNNLHYSSLPNFSFFADSVQKLAERIQVNLDRIYTGDKQWTVNVSTEKTGKTDVNVVINNQTCWDALALVKSEFGLNFIVRGRTITIGTEGIAVGKVFSYGKGNGLISVERNAESDQKVITRLRAYGSTKNMPESYYKNVGLQVFGELIWRMFANTFYLNIPYEAKLFTKSSERGKEVVFNVNGEESTGYVTRHTATDEFEGCCELHFDSSELASKLQEGMKVYFTSHVNKTEFPRANKEYAENVPNNMAVRHLMLPSFPTETTDPYIDSENIGELGIREATVFFDGSNGNEEIYPSMEGMTAEDLKAAGVECAAEGALDEVVSAEQIEDDGFFKEGSTIETFKITLKDVGFDINDHLSVSGNATIAFNTGMCGGRDFEIVECKKEGANYVLTCNRHYDESLDLYFPYKYYQIKSGDKFVLINIEMPDVYVQAASQRLLTAAKWYLGNNDYVRYSYVPRIDNIFLAREHDEAVKNGEASIHDTIKEGDLMLFHDADLGIEGSVIIDTLSIREGESLIPEYEVTLRNNKTVGTITKIQNQIDSIVSGKVGTGGGYNAAQIKSLIDSYGQTLFLSKTKDDRSEGLIASDKGFVVGDFNEGTLGSGASIFEREGNTYGEVDFLKVRKKATFTNITVQELKHVGGEIILSPAAMICSRVEESENGWKCYFNTEDSEGRKVYQEFAVNDLARCQTFNLSPKGANDLAGNHYYWRKVVSVGDDYIELSKTECDAQSDAPQVGDNIAQLGNTSDKERQAAIILSAFGSDAPSYKQYNGIDGFSLEGKQVTKLSPYGNELTGILNIEAGSKGASNLEDFPDEVFKAVHIGAVNLLLNSGFTGDYTSEELNAPEYIQSDNELFSCGMKNWSGIATISNDSESVSGKSANIGSLSQNVELIKGESYVVSFKAKGSTIAVTCGDFSKTQTLTSSYGKYSFKFVSNGSGNFLISGSAKVCDLQIERGTIATDWKPSPYDNDKTLAEFQALKYIQDAIREGDTTILGGLILTAMIQLGNYKNGKMQKVNAGVSGIYNDDDDVAFWGGGTFEQAIKTVMKFKNNPTYHPSTEEWMNMANFVITHGGVPIFRGSVFAENGYFRGKLEQGNNATVLEQDGSGHLANGSIAWNPYGIMYRKGHDVKMWTYISEFADTLIVDLNKGTYLDLTYVLTEDTFTLPNPEFDGVSLFLRWEQMSRSNACAVLEGSFSVKQSGDNGLEYTEVGRLTLDVASKEFELVYKNGNWVYIGENVIIEDGVARIGRIVEVENEVVADKITSNSYSTGDNDGATKTFNIKGVNGDFELTFSAGLFIGYKFTPNSTGN